MHRFYVPPGQISGREAFLVGEQCRQIRTVLRMKPGEEISLFDGSGREYTARIEDLSCERVLASILDIRWPETESSVCVTVVLSLLKGDRTELVLQKCTELGAAGFVLMRAQRTVPKVEESRLQRRFERWQAVVREAAEQSGRVRLPEISGVYEFREAVRRVSNNCQVLIAWEQEGSQLLAEVVRNIPRGNIAYVVGPEGGFAPDEVDYAVEVGAITVSLGPRTLRSETAAIAGTAILVLCNSQ